MYMGKNSVLKVPHEIAALLKLPDPSEYTFHSFRRTAISLMRWRRTRRCFNRQGFPPLQSLRIRRLASMGYCRGYNQADQTISALPTANGTNINLKVIVVNNMSGNINL